MNHITSKNPESTMMGQPTTIVAVYPTHTAAEAAVHELKQSGFDLRKLSIIGRDYHTEEHVLGYYNVGDRMKAWGKAGAFWGALWGLLFGSAYFWIPGLGPLLVAGPLVKMIVAALEGAVIAGGLGVMVGALSGIGIPEDSILRYETALRADRFLLIVQGRDYETAPVQDILHRTSPESMEQHD